ncbi:MAG: hypothetical protein U0795_18050 [Pirellulales bacterium]
MNGGNPYEYRSAEELAVAAKFPGGLLHVALFALVGALSGFCSYLIKPTLFGPPILFSVAMVAVTSWSSRCCPSLPRVIGFIGMSVVAYLIGGIVLLSGGFASGIKEVFFAGLSSAVGALIFAAAYELIVSSVPRRGFVGAIALAGLLTGVLMGWAHAGDPRADGGLIIPVWQAIVSLVWGCFIVFHPTQTVSGSAPPKADDAPQR